MNMYKRPARDGRLIYSSSILAELAISDRCLRQWISDGRFPHPDGNLHGRKFWLFSSYQKWLTQAVAGRFSRPRNPRNLAAQFPSHKIA